MCALLKLEEEALALVSLLQWQMEVHVGCTHAGLFGATFSVDAKVEGQVSCNEKKVDEKPEASALSCLQEQEGRQRRVAISIMSLDNLLAINVEIAQPKPSEPGAAIVSH